MPLQLRTQSRLSKLKFGIACYPAIRTSLHRVLSQSGDFIFKARKSLALELINLCRQNPTRSLLMPSEGALNWLICSRLRHRTQTMNYPMPRTPEPDETQSLPLFRLERRYHKRHKASRKMQFHLQEARPRSRMPEADRISKILLRMICCWTCRRFLTSPRVMHLNQHSNRNPRCNPRGGTSTIAMRTVHAQMAFNPLMSFALGEAMYDS